MDLRCRKTQCKFNNHYTCKARSICIGKGMECETYENNPDKEVPDTSRCMFEEAPKYAPQREKKRMKVTCMSKCLFNKNGICIANGITVNSLKNCPYCITYIRP